MYKRVVLADFNKASYSYDEAPIIITTQQMLAERTSFFETFSDVSTYFFKGAPRKVKVWDESLEPDRKVEVNVFTVGSLNELLRQVRAKSRVVGSGTETIDEAPLREAIAEVATVLQNTKVAWRNTEHYAMPDFNKAICDSIEGFNTAEKKLVFFRECLAEVRGQPTTSCKLLYC